MTLIEIIVIICIVLIFLAVIGTYIYKRIHHMPTGECACCKKVNTSKIYKEYRKKYPLTKN